MSIIHLTKTFTKSYAGDITAYGSVDVDEGYEGTVYLAVENPDRDWITTMEASLTPDEARQIAAELLRVADLLDSNPANT